MLLGEGVCIYIVGVNLFDDLVMNWKQEMCWQVALDVMISGIEEEIQRNGNLVLK